MTTLHPGHPGHPFEVPAASHAYLARAATSLREAITTTEVPQRYAQAHVAALRATAALLEVAERFPDASVVVATHGAVIGSLIRALSSEDLPVHGVSVGNGSRHDFAIVDGALRIVGVDDSGDVVVADVDLDDVLSPAPGA